LIREYVWLGWDPVAVIEGGVVSFVRADHIGRPVFATNASGVKVWTATYNPFGGVYVSTGSPPTARFPGQWFQSESGLHQNWMRDYDPTTGRYLQADPLGLVDGASVYGYVRGNPGRWMDPTGLEDDRPSQSDPKSANATECTQCVEGETPEVGSTKKPKKYTKPDNPNKRKGADDRRPGGNRERNVGHPEGEEHSIKPKGGFRPRIGPLFLYLDFLNCTCIGGIDIFTHQPCWIA
jgi:RHS repeat-associated protein